MDDAIPHDLNENEIGLLLLVNRLVSSEKTLSSQTLLPFAEFKLPDVARDYQYTLLALCEKGILQGTNEAFTLTPIGESIVISVAREHSLHAWFYNAYYQAVLHSPAHSRFCERVYGKDLSQHGMADLEQLLGLLDGLGVEKGMSMLDFGCGDGKITEYLSGLTGALISGVDIADRAIELAVERTRSMSQLLKFICADLCAYPGTFSRGSFDRIYAIDSLFFVPDPCAILDVLLDYLVPGGILAVFTIAPQDVLPEQSRLGVLLGELGVSFTVVDYSMQNNRHWQLKKQVLLDLEPDFYAEGNQFLFKNRFVECDGMELWQRYLFFIRPSLKD